LRDCIGAIKQLYFLNKEDFKPRKLFMEWWIYINEKYEILVVRSVRLKP
jgi:hypothetical protein